MKDEVKQHSIDQPYDEAIGWQHNHSIRKRANGEQGKPCIRGSYRQKGQSALAFARQELFGEDEQPADYAFLHTAVKG